MTDQRVKLSSLIIALLLVAAWALHAQAQQSSIHYLYDDLGRLAGVVDQDGNAATYTYDAVGNILAIDRHNVAETAGPVAITLVSPNEGKVGTAVWIFGRGFSGNPLQNMVSFGGAVAAVNAATANSLTTSVPLSALTGPITVTTPLGTANSPEPFTVFGVVSISPVSAVLFPKATQQFTAAVSGTTTPVVKWMVNGVEGGDATVGTISSAGLYTAPMAVPSPQTLTITAVNKDNPNFDSSASVVIAVPPDKILAHPVSVGLAPSASTVVNNLTALPVSVQVAASASTVVTPLQAPLVSVGFVGLTGQAAFLASLPVAVALQPFIATVSPSNGLRGVAGLSMLVTGAGLAGATSLNFQLNGVNDANLTATNLTVSPDGTEAMATLTITSGAAPGPRVVRITTPAGTSTATGTGGNLITVQ